MRSKESVRKLSKSAGKKKYFQRESESGSLKELVSRNNVQKLEMLKLDLMVWVVLFLRILILGNSDKARLAPVVETLSQLDLFGILVTVYVRVTEPLLREFFLEDFCRCQSSARETSPCSDEYCANGKICQLTRRIVHASLELFLVVSWLREYHDFEADFPDALGLLERHYPK